MYNLVISLAVGIAVGLAITLFGFPLWAAIVPGFVAMVGCFILLGRRINTRIQGLVEVAQKELSAAPANAREQKARIDKAVKIFEEGLKWEKWQFLVGPELHAQIGMIKYMGKDLDGAQASFQKGSARNYMAKAMEGALYYQRKDAAKMEAAFEAAVKSGKKEAIVWATYAWCLLQHKEKDKALKVMARAVENNPTEEKLKSGLTQLQNDKKLKMKPYEPLWWQFGLENPPLQAMGGRPVRFERR